MKSEHDRPITIEDLLRLKRAERPEAEFWNTFDRQLRAKQLSALVGKRPWWQSVPEVFSRVFRYRVLLGASAVVALSVVTVRYHQSPAAGSAHRSDQVAEQPVAVLEPAPATTVASPLIVAEVPRVENFTSSLAEPVSVASVMDIAPAPEPVHVAEAAAPLVGGLKLEQATAMPSPAAREIAANLAVLRAAETSMSRTLLAQNAGFEVRSAAVRTPVEPLQQITPPGESRRSRLLTAMVATATQEDSYRTTERAANRIEQDRLYDQIHRFDARGDRVHWKF